MVPEDVDKKSHEIFHVQVTQQMLQQELIRLSLEPKGDAGPNLRVL